MQVHPLTAYIQRHFGMPYTQDESYYILDAAADASVYLGLKNDIDPSVLTAELHAAQDGGAPFDPEKYVNRFPARKHDHFLIPAGTVHCSGGGNDGSGNQRHALYFHFQNVWDWGRMGLDGKPRPIHLQHGFANLQWDRTTEWTRKNLVNVFEPLDSGPGWCEERTGPPRARVY